MDKDRRRFLKIILIGSGTLLVGKVFGPFLLKFFEDSSSNVDLLAQASPPSFRVVEDKNYLSIYDNSGMEIFQIDKGA